MTLAAVLGFGIPLAFFALVAGVIFFVARSAIRSARMSREKQEAYFVSMFPDLQPWFHPAKLVEFVTARLAKPPPPGGAKGKAPAGFAAPNSEVRFDTDSKGRPREAWTILDAVGNRLTQFLFETHPEGGVIRVGDGKFTVDTRVPAQPKVRYWHPDREFKWTPALWRFTTRVAESSIDSSDSGTSWSSDSSSGARTAAGAAGIAAAGGAFDGGGASAAWDDAGSRSSSSSTSY
jgi:uncharacterized membrane protein YgcG